MPKNRLSEALALSEEILRNIELNELPLENICLKTSRLARLLNDQVRRQFYAQNASSIGQREVELETSRTQLSVARDPDVSVQSANPQQWVMNPMGNTLERNLLSNTIRKNSQLLKAAKSQIYRYVLDIHYELRFGSVQEEIFQKTRHFVDLKLSEMVPEAVSKFISAFDNLKSENPEDWSNAVGSCRRILKAVADKLYPPNPGGQEEIEKNGKRIKVGPDHYLNRLILYVQDKSKSRTFKSIVGSHLEYFVERLEAVLSAGHKGAHEDIQTAEEAERYIIYTYLLIGDLLRLEQGEEKGARPVSKEGEIKLDTEPGISTVETRNPF